MPLVRTSSSSRGAKGPCPPLTPGQTSQKRWPPHCAASVASHAPPPIRTISRTTTEYSLKSNLGHPGVSANHVSTIRTYVIIVLIYDVNVNNDTCAQNCFVNLKRIMPMVPRGMVPNFSVFLNFSLHILILYYWNSFHDFFMICPES